MRISLATWLRIMLIMLAGSAADSAAHSASVEIPSELPAVWVTAAASGFMLLAILKLHEK